MSRKSATIFGTGAIPEPSTSHIGKGVALVAQTTAFVYIYARISQIAEMTLSFHATQGDSRSASPPQLPDRSALSELSVDFSFLARHAQQMVLLYLVLPETIPCVLLNLAILIPIASVYQAQCRNGHIFSDVCRLQV